jgi:hypothetical protein
MNMPLRARTRTRPRRDANPRRPHAARAVVSPPERTAGFAEERWRSEGGPRDKALYVCECGAHFEASVSASVGCPRCGASQSW